MNQSTIIFGYLFAAFVIYITQRGELPTYWGFLVSTPNTAPSGPQAAGSGALTGSVQQKTDAMNKQNLDNATKFASTVAKIATFI